MLLSYKNKFKILYSGECRNTRVHISKSKGVAEMTNKRNKIKTKKGLLRLQVLRFIASIHTVGVQY